MNYPELLKLMQSLIEKDDKTPQELQLLAELQSLYSVIKRGNYSLSL